MEDLDKIEARYPDNDPIDNDVRALIAELRATRLQNERLQNALRKIAAMPVAPSEANGATKALRTMALNAVDGFTEKR